MEAGSGDSTGSPTTTVNGDVGRPPPMTSYRHSRRVSDEKWPTMMIGYSGGSMSDSQGIAQQVQSTSQASLEIDTMPSDRQ